MNAAAAALRSWALKYSGVLAALFVAAGAGGCVATQSDSAAAATAGEMRGTQTRSEAGGSGSPVRAGSGREAARSAPIRLPAYRVQEGAFSDFGMSVKTNFEVASGGPVQWMEVSGLEPGGSAVGRGLAVGDRILALDTVAVTTLSKAAMLEALFQRKKGEQMRVLVMAQRDAFPRFVVLVAGRSGPMR